MDKVNITIKEVPQGDKLHKIMKLLTDEELYFETERNTTTNNKEILSNLMIKYDFTVFGNDKFEDLYNLCEEYVKYKNGELEQVEIPVEEEKEDSNVCKVCNNVFDDDDEFKMTGVCCRCRDRNSR